MVDRPHDERKYMKRETSLMPLHAAAAIGDLEKVELLLAQGYSPLTLNSHGQLPMHCALLLPISSDKHQKNRKTDIFNLLSADVPLAHQDEDGNTVAHVMAAYGFDELLSSLLKKDANLVTMANNKMECPIHIAIMNGQLIVVERLLDIKNVANLQDAQGWRAVHYAACYGSPAMVERCCQSANIDMPDNEGRTPWMIARECGNIAAMKILEQHGAKHLAEQLNDPRFM